MAIVQDVRYAVRVLRRSALQSVIIILTLAIGLGANTAIFTVVDAVVLRPLEYAEPDQLVAVWTDTSGTGGGTTPVPYQDYEDWTQQSQAFQQLAAMRVMAMNLADGELPERVTALRATPNLLALLRISPALGRDFAPEEGSPGKGNVVIISHTLWQQRYGSSPEVIGRKISLEGQPFTIVGVLPRSAVLPQGARASGPVHLVFPLVPQNNERNRSLAFLRVIGRMKAGVTVEGARADLNTINARIEQADANAHQGWKIIVTDLKESTIGPIKPVMVTMLASVGFVLLVACVNVASILVGRGVARSGEFAIRSALGANRGRLLRQSLTEALVISALGAVLGLALAWALMMIAQESLASTLPRSTELRLDLRILSVCAGVATLCGLIFGMLPALQTSGAQPVHAMKEGGRGGSAGRLSRSVLRGLVIAETALALLLLLGAGLMIRSFLRLTNVDPGFSPERLIAMQVDIPQSKYPDQQAQWSFHERALNIVRDLPGVEQAAAVSLLPMFGGNQSTTYQLEENQRPPTEWSWADARLVSARYFESMSIPVVAGREFSEHDRHNSPRVALVNGEFVRRNLPGQNPIGQRIQVFPETAAWREIVGVVGDVKLIALDNNTEPAIYLPMAQNPFLAAGRRAFIVVRTNSHAGALFEQVRREVRSLDEGQAVGSPIILADLVAASTGPQRVATLLLATFAGFALLLAAIGIYGVSSLFVALRTREIGTRMALGAQRSHIYRMILGEAALLSGAAVALGSLAALLLSRSLQKILFEVQAADPVMFASTAAALLLVGIGAAYVPARRASRIDPMRALRCE